MNARLVSHLVGLYPQEWRTRYGEEFQTFLETYPSNVRTILNVIGGALYERVLSLGRFTMERRQDSLALMLYAYLSAVAAGMLDCGQRVVIFKLRASVLIDSLLIPVSSDVDPGRSGRAFYF